MRKVFALAVLLIAAGTAAQTGHHDQINGGVHDARSLAGTYVPLASAGYTKRDSRKEPAWVACSTVVAEALEEFASANVRAVAGKKWRLPLLSETSGTQNNCVPLLLSRG
jgi:hypothetical protein